MRERVRATDADVETLCLACMHVDELMTERASLAAGAEQALTKHDTLATGIRELEVAEANCDGKLGVVVRAVRSLKEGIAAGENHAVRRKIGLMRG